MANNQYLKKSVYPCTKWKQYETGNKLFDLILFQGNILTIWKYGSCNKRNYPEEKFNICQQWMELSDDGGSEILWSRRRRQGRGSFFSGFQILVTLMFSCSLCRLCRSRFRSCRMRCTLKTRRRDWLSYERSLPSSISLGRTLQRSQIMDLFC